MVLPPLPANLGWRGVGGWGGAFNFTVLLSLTCRYYSSSVAIQTASLGLAGVLLSVLLLYSFVELKDSHKTRQEGISQRATQLNYQIYSTEDAKVAGGRRGTGERRGAGRGG